MNTVLKFFTKKENIITTIIILLFVGLSATVYFQNKKILKLTDKYQSEVKLKNALLDTITVFKNKEGEWVKEKLTIQATVSSLERMNNQLTSSQKELLKRVSEIEKTNSIIAAALIETNVKLDSLKNNKGIVNKNDSSVVFNDSTSDLQYTLKVHHVLPIKGYVPTLSFEKFNLPNKQFIEFHWKNNKKIGYPVSFSVSNTNKYFKTYNINSYTIPEIKKNNLKPTGWDKFKQWFKNGGNKGIYLGGGIVIGGGIVYLLIK